MDKYFRSILSIAAFVLLLTLSMSPSAYGAVVFNRNPAGGGYDAFLSGETWPVIAMRLLVLPDVPIQEVRWWGTYNLNEGNPPVDDFVIE
ncbi:MAG: hypothetical protein JSW26_07535 [Desulfobacterales bacterium]|nr:MAG: hypothetical protein JSW26_07535 [Desulfobacterales bacterium]